MSGCHGDTLAASKHLCLYGNRKSLEMFVERQRTWKQNPARSPAGPAVLRRHAEDMLDKACGHEHPACMDADLRPEAKLLDKME